MINDFLIVHKSILPQFFELVLKARDLIDNENYSVSDACKAVDISRSTFYKYKDCIYYPSKELGRKAIFTFKTQDEKGTLMNILNVVYEFGGNVTSIQGTPIKNMAYVTATIDLTNFNGQIENLTARFREIKSVKAVNVIAID